MSRHPDDDLPALPPEWSGLVIPDDARELTGEVQAVRRELRAERRRRHLGRMATGAVFGRGRFPVPIALFVLGVTILLGGLSFLLAPSRTGAPRPSALAAPSAPAGSTGGLLPDVSLNVGVAGSVRLRTIRPAVVVLEPVRCDCRAVVDAVARAASDGRLPVVLVGTVAEPGPPTAESAGQVIRAVDSNGALATAYQVQTGPVALFVRSDGVVAPIVRNPRSDSRLRDEVAALS